MPHLIMFFLLTLISIYFFTLMKNWFHTIMILMIMEMLMLFNFFLLTMLSANSFSLGSLFLFSTFMVIEASLGMSILTLIVRSHGNDYLLIF